MKNYILTLLSLLIAFVTSGQQPSFDKIESARIGLITERLGLTTEQAEKFWPLYREYTQQRQELRKEFLDARKQVDRQQLTEEESQRLLQLGMQIKEREVAMDRNYTERMGNVISNRQLLELRKAEQDFRRMLMERLQNQGVDRDRIRQRQQIRDNNH